jgi:hypothetical protein
MAIPFARPTPALRITASSEIKALKQALHAARSAEANGSSFAAGELEYR